MTGMHYPWARMAVLMSKRTKDEPEDQPEDNPDTPTERGAADPGLDDVFRQVVEDVQAERYPQAVDRLSTHLKDADQDVRRHILGALVHVHLTASLAYSRKSGRKSQRAAIKHLAAVCRTASEATEGASIDDNTLQRFNALLSLFTSNSETALSLYPQAPPPSFSHLRWATERGILATAAHQGESALAELEQAWATALDDTTPSSKTEELRGRVAECIGASYWERQDWDSSIAWWERSLSMGRLGVISSLCFAYYRAGASHRETDPGRALTLWEAACRLEPKSSIARAAGARATHLHLVAAVAAWRNTDAATAAARWRHAVRISPDCAPGYFGLALASLKSEQWIEAQSRAEAGLRCAAPKESLSLRRALIAALIMQGKLEQATLETKRLVDQIPGDVETEALGGLLLLVNGEASAAHQCLTLLARDSAHSIALLGAAVAARAIGNAKEAQTLLEEVSTLDPDDAWTWSHLATAPPSNAAYDLASSMAQAVCRTKPVTPAAEPGVEPLEISYRGPDIPDLAWWLDGGDLP